MNTALELIAMEYLDLHAKNLVKNIRDGYVSDETKQKYALALDLLDELLELKIKNIDSYGIYNNTNEDKERRWSIAKSKKLELISIITQL